MEYDWQSSITLPISPFLVFHRVSKSLKIQAPGSTQELPPRPALLPHHLQYFTDFLFHTFPPPNSLSLPLWPLCVTDIHLLPVVLFFLILGLLHWCLAKPAQLHLPELYSKHILSPQTSPLQVGRSGFSSHPPCEHWQPGTGCSVPLPPAAGKMGFTSFSTLLRAKPYLRKPLSLPFPISVLSWVELGEVQPLENWYFWVG